MAGTFSKIYLQIVFSVKHRAKLIHPSWEERLHKYMTSTIEIMGQKVIAINGMPDHIHIFIGFVPSCTLSDLIREIKKTSSVFVRDNRLVPSGFSWQSGYGVFSYGHSQIPNVIKYIENQKEHHRVKSFDEEYKEFMEKFEVDYKEKYLLG